MSSAESHHDSNTKHLSSYNANGLAQLENLHVGHTFLC